MRGKRIEYGKTKNVKKGRFLSFLRDVHRKVTLKGYLIVSCYSTNKMVKMFYLYYTKVSPTNYHL